MGISINKNGEIIVVKTVELNEAKMRKLIKTMVLEENTYSGDLAHARWTTLYNAYDLYYDTNIREEHEQYKNDKKCSMPRLTFMADKGLLNKLLFVASKLYKNQFEMYVEDFIQ